MSRAWLLLAALLCRIVPVAAVAADLPAMPELQRSDRVLVIAPHPDDESLCCAGILQRARANGAAVAVVWITAGDGFEFDAMLTAHALWPHGAPSRQLGVRRVLEARAAADELGVPRAAQFVLGYPDGGVSALMADYYRRPYYSPYTELSAVPYADALSPGASYTGEHLERDLERVIEAFRPTLVLAAAPQDAHPDHSASSALVRHVLERRGELNELRYWIVHSFFWPWPRLYEPQLPLVPPENAAALHWQSMPLTPMERARKRAALRAHHSQYELLWPFMDSFVRTNEILASPGAQRP
jgi:LmbE family N-acetylglucosaminyl deacetylase